MTNKETKQEKKPTFMTHFRVFLVNSTLIEWALGWIAGEVISRFLTSLVHDVLFPFISGVFFDGSSLNELIIVINGREVLWGTMLINVADMIVVFLVVFFVCELVYFMRKRYRIPEDEEDSFDELIEVTKENTKLLGDVRDLLAKQK